MKRAISMLLAIVLAIGLMPLPSYAFHEPAAAPLALMSDSSLEEPTGLQLNENPETTGPDWGSTKTRYGVMWSYIEKGDVAVVFEGAKAPRLGLTNKDDNNAWAYAEASDVEWNADKSAGVAWYTPEGVKAAWLAKTTNGNPNTIGSLRKVFVQSDSKDPVTVNRIVLTGMSPLPDVSGGAYGNVTTRRLYTRPVALFTSPDSGQQLYRTVNISIDNPVYDGADIAVRYTGDSPYLTFCDAAWKVWAHLDVGQGARTVSAEDGTGQKVTFFTRAEIDALWNERAGQDGPARAHMYVSVHPQSEAYPAGSQECRIVEVVALGGADRVSLSDSQLHKVSGRSVEQIAQDMKAGYNLGGHLESNYVPQNPTKDGGWGYSDLESEAQWARGVYITRETIHNLKQEGFKAIRLPITWFQHIYPEGDPTSSQSPPADPIKRYHIDRAWIERVHEIVDWCIAEDLYVIVNIHHEDWIDRPDLGTAYTETDLPVKFAAVWTQIADEFKGYDQRLVFEDMNEPHAYFFRDDGTKDWGFATAETVTTVNRLNADFVKLMRGFSEESGHRERLLMLAHDTGNGDISHTGFVMPDDPSHMLAHSIHCYTPHDWTHYFAEGNHKDETGELNVYTATYRAAVDATWENIRSRYTSQGYPVILGEFGCYYLGESRQQDRLDWMAQFATHAKELGIPLFYWRMDRTKLDENNAEYVEWSAFDEQRQEISALSKDMLAKWFEILGDDSVRWGSNATIEEGEHVAITDENKLSGQFPREIYYVDGSVRGTDDSWRTTVPVTWDELVGNEIAVRYAGNTPRLGLVRKSADETGKTWQGNWWGFSADTVDEVNHIAYFSAESVKNNWQRSCPTYDLSTLSHLVLRVPDSGYDPPTSEDKKLATTVQAVAIVHKHEWGAWQRAGTEGEEEAWSRTCTAQSCPDGTQTRVAHEWGSWVTERAATCTEDGVQVRTCRHDGARQERVAKAAGHWWNAPMTDVEPTCTQAGSRSVRCATCGLSEEEPLPALGHDWGEWRTTKEPTYEAAGEQARVCAHDSSHVETREVARLVKPVDEDGNGDGDGKLDDGKVDDGKTDDEKRNDEKSDDGKIDDGKVDGDKIDDGEVDDGKIDDQDPLEQQPEGEQAPPADVPLPWQAPAVEPEQIDFSGIASEPGDEAERGGAGAVSDGDGKPEGGSSDAGQQEGGVRDSAGQGASKTAAQPASTSQGKGSAEANSLVATSGSVRFALKRTGPNKVKVIGAEKLRVYTVKVNTVKDSNGRTLNVTAIGNGAFRAARMTRVQIGGNVKTIGASAFANCRSLTTVDIGKNVTSIGKGAFQGCNKLQVVKLRSSKLTKASFKRLASCPRVKSIKLAGMSKAAKNRAIIRYGRWLPAGMRLR